MKKQEVLDFMKWSELPEAADESTAKCPVLVERTNKTRDYAISNKGKIVADKKFRAMITKVLEYYPEKAVSDEEIAKIEADKAAKVEKAIAKAKADAERIIADEKKAAKKAEAKIKAAEKKAADEKLNKETGLTKRERMIEFLVSKKNKPEVLESKPTDELFILCKKFGKEF